MYRQIVVPLDQSTFAEHALGAAIEVARAADAKLTLFAADPTEGSASYLRDTADRLPVPAGFVVRSADHPVDAIAAMAQPDTLLCMATHGRSGPRRALLGSVAEAVLRQVTEPVLLTGPFAWRQHPVTGGRVLVCLDGSERAEGILPLVAGWAKAFDMRVFLASVAHASVATGHELGDEILEFAYHHDIAQDLVDRGVRVEWEVLHGGHPVDRLIEIASHLPATIVAMTTHGRSGLPRAVLGSVSMGVVQGSPCPVLVARSV